MALIFSGTSAIGRVRYNNALANGGSLIFLFPNEPLDVARFKGTLEVLSLNTPLNRYVQKQVFPLWVDSTLVPGTVISNATHRLSVVWRLDGLPFEVHTT